MLRGVRTGRWRWRATDEGNQPLLGSRPLSALHPRVGANAEETTESSLPRKGTFVLQQQLLLLCDSMQHTHIQPCSWPIDFLMAIIVLSFVFCAMNFKCYSCCFHFNQPNSFECLAGTPVAVSMMHIRQLIVFVCLFCYAHLRVCECAARHQLANVQVLSKKLNTFF